MLDQRQFRRSPESIATTLEKRGIKLDLSTYRSLENDRKLLQTQLEALQQQRNEISKSIGMAKAQGESIEPLIEGQDHLRSQLQVVQTELNHVLDDLNEFLLSIPNLPDATVPQGTTEEDNLVLREEGTIPSFNFEVLDHVDLAGDWISSERAVKIAGSRFSVMKGDVVRLHRGLTQFMLDLHINDHGYQELYVPYIVNRESMQSTGQLPKFEEDLFRIDGDDGFYLIPTAEVPITNMVKDQILDLDELPLKYVAHTPCFRSEAGSYGKDTRGMIRQHQFEKVELVHIVEPVKSWEALDELTSHAEKVLKLLDLPFRAVVLCGGDLGFAAAKTIDLEVWLPGQKKYREISSCSNFLDFQARRALARYRPAKDRKPELVHTLNGSGLAVGRTLVAILENFQDMNRKVSIPRILQPYVGGMDRIDFSDSRN